MIGWLGSVLVIGGRVLLAHGVLGLGFAVSLTGDLAWVLWGLWYNPTGRPIWSIVLLDTLLLLADLWGVVLNGEIRWQVLR